MSEYNRSIVPQEKSHRGFQINESQNFKLKDHGRNAMDESSREKKDASIKKATDVSSKAFKFLQVKSQFNANSTLILKIEETSVHDSFTGMSDDESRGRLSRTGRSLRLQSRNDEAKAGTPLSPRHSKL